MNRLPPPYPRYTPLETCLIVLAFVIALVVWSALIIEIETGTPAQGIVARWIERIT